MRLRPCGLALALALGALRASAAPFSAAANVAGLALLGWNASGPSITFRVSGALPSYAVALGIGQGMDGSTSYVGWLDASGAGHVVGYYMENGNMSAGAVYPTGEALSGVAVSRAPSGILSFSFTKALAPQPGPGVVPDRLLFGTSQRCNATPCFPLATIDPSSPGGTPFVAALFSSWSVVNVLTDHPQPADKHFVHTGLWWTQTPRWVDLNLHDGRVMNAAMVAAAGEGQGPVALSSDVSPTLWAPHHYVPLQPAGAAALSVTTEGSSEGSDNGKAGMGGMAGMAGMGVGEGGAGTMSGMAGMGASAGSMGTMSMDLTDTSRFASPLIFVGAVINTPSRLAGGIILSAMWAFTSTVLPSFGARAEAAGASAGAPRGYVAAGALSNVLRMGLHYGSMLLVMSFQVWIILGVLGGHALGYITVACLARRGVVERDAWAVVAAGADVDGGVMREAVLVAKGGGEGVARPCECC